MSERPPDDEQPPDDLLEPGGDADLDDAAPAHAGGIEPEEHFGPTPPG